MTTQECPKCGPVPDVELYGIEYHRRTVGAATGLMY